MNRRDSRRSWLSPLVGAALALGCVEAPATDVLVLDQVAVVDVANGAVRSGMRVAVAGDRIEQVAPADQYSIPRGARVVDARGKYVIPGLWDMHVHLQGWWEAAFPLFLAHGVLGVREMGGESDRILALRDSVARGERLGPRMMVAGTMLDGPTPDWPFRVTVRNAEEARAAVRSHVARGVDFIKVKENLSREAYLATAEMAKELGIPFAGHVPSGMDAAEAARTGQRSIEHLTGTSGEETDVFLEHGTWHDPTLVVMAAFLGMEDTNWDRQDRSIYLTAGARELWDWSMSLNTQPLPPRAAREQWLAGSTAVLRRLHAAGVKLLAGTDLSIPTIYPGFALHDELALLVAAGLSPLEALQAATIQPARYFGRESEWGSVEAGKIADLVVLDANPVEAIAATGRIRAVIVRGELLERTALDAMLEAARVRRDSVG